MLLCDDLEGWNVGLGGRLKREGIYVYVSLIHAVVEQKPTQNCKAIILQFKKKKAKNKKILKIFLKSFS